MVFLHGLTYEHGFKPWDFKDTNLWLNNHKDEAELRQYCSSPAENSWLWGRSVTHFQWYQLHPIHVIILKPFDTAECQNRTSQAGYWIVSAGLESKPKNCWDFKTHSKEEWRQSHPTCICCSQQEKTEKGTEDTPAPRDKTWGSPTPPQHIMKDPAEPAWELLPTGVTTPD